MSGVELAFFAGAAATVAAFAWGLRHGGAAWLWWSCIPHAVLLRAPIAVIAFACVGLAEWISARYVDAPLVEGDPLVDADVDVERHPDLGLATDASDAAVAVLPRVLVLGLVAFVLIGTWARQVVTEGVTAEEAPRFGEFADAFKDTSAHSVSLGWCLAAAGLFVAAMLHARAQRREERGV